MRHPLLSNPKRDEVQQQRKNTESWYLQGLLCYPPTFHMFQLSQCVSCSVIYNTKPHIFFSFNFTCIIQNGFLPLTPSFVETPWARNVWTTGLFTSEKAKTIEMSTTPALTSNPKHGYLKALSWSSWSIFLSESGTPVVPFHLQPLCGKLWQKMPRWILYFSSVLSHILKEMKRWVNEMKSC